MAREERDCWWCDRSRVLRFAHPMERPAWTTCGHCGGTGKTLMFVYPKPRRRRAS
jgi:hypothetical protein